MILVTGATGLNGAELVRRLSARGVAVRALDRNANGTNAAKSAELSRLPGVQIAPSERRGRQLILVIAPVVAGLALPAVLLVGHVIGLGRLVDRVASCGGA